MRAAEPVPAAGIARVAIIGAGQAGRQFALRCALSGFRVVLEDVMPANLRRAQAEFADLSGQMGPGSMEFALTVEDAVRDAEIAIDFVPDELESKLEIFCLIDRMAPPRTILCTPSEALCVTDLASCTYRGDRCVMLRGLATGAVRLLHPRRVAEDALAQVTAMLRGMGFEVTAERDPDLPMLMKNMGYEAGDAEIA